MARKSARCAAKKKQEGLYNPEPTTTSYVDINVFSEATATLSAKSLSHLKSSKSSVLQEIAKDCKLKLLHNAPWTWVTLSGALEKLNSAQNYIKQQIVSANPHLTFAKKPDFSENGFNKLGTCTTDIGVQADILNIGKPGRKLRSLCNAEKAVQCYLPEEVCSEYVIGLEHPDVDVSNTVSRKRRLECDEKPNVEQKKLKLQTKPVEDCTQHVKDSSVQKNKEAEIKVENELEINTNSNKNLLNSNVNTSNSPSKNAQTQRSKSPRKISSSKNKSKEGTVLHIEENTKIEPELLNQLENLDELILPKEMKSHVQAQTSTLDENKSESYMVLLGESGSEEVVQLKTVNSESSVINENGEIIDIRSLSEGDVLLESCVRENIGSLPDVIHEVCVEDGSCVLGPVVVLNQDGTVKESEEETDKAEDGKKKRNRKRTKPIKPPKAPKIPKAEETKKNPKPKKVSKPSVPVKDFSKEGRILENGVWLIPCDKCSYKARKPHLLQAHMRLHQSGARVFKCDLCNFSALQGTAVARHEKLVHYDHLYECDQCEYKTPSRDRLADHKKYRHRKKSLTVFTCPMCHFKSTHEHDYKHHLEVHKAPRGADVEEGTLAAVFRCALCNYRNEKKKLFRRHIYNVHLCLACGELCKTQEELREHSKSHKDKTNLLCDECGKNFSSVKTLFLHKKYHTGEYNYLCDCGLPFATKHTLWSHKRNIHGVKSRFQCDQCDKTFTRQEYLRYHQEKVHVETETLEAAKEGVDVTLFQCEHCSYTSHSQDLILTHTRHTHRKLDTAEHGCVYECTLCGFKTLHTSGYQRHLTTHPELTENDVVTILQLPADYFSCGICEYTTNSEEILQDHVYEEHKCGTCSQVFNIKDDLINHRNTVCNKKQVSFECSECKENFNTQEALSVHVTENPSHKHTNRRGRPAKQSKADSPGRKTESSPGIADTSPDKMDKSPDEAVKSPDKTNKSPGKKEKKDPMKDLILQCHICQDEFESSELLKSHLETHSVACETCGASFYRKDSLQKHILRSHKNAEMFPCQFCGKIFNRKGNLDFHVKKQHAEDKPVKYKPDETTFQVMCEKCGKKFENKSRLNEHEKVHMTEKPISCDICGNTFKTERHCQLHKLRIHVKMFQCHMCRCKFTQEKNLKNHIHVCHEPGNLIQPEKDSNNQEKNARREESPKTSQDKNKTSEVSDDNHTSDLLPKQEVVELRTNDGSNLSNQGLLVQQDSETGQASSFILVNSQTESPQGEDACHFAEEQVLSDPLQAVQIANLEDYPELTGTVLVKWETEGGGEQLYALSL